MFWIQKEVHSCPYRSKQAWNRWADCKVIHPSSPFRQCCIVQTSRIFKPTANGGHGESEPRSVGVLANAHGMTLLLQRKKAQEPQLSMCFAVASRVKIFWSPSGTLCPKARGLSPQHIWERTPCVSAAWPCFPCPPNCQTTRWEIFPHEILTLPMTLNSWTWTQWNVWHAVHSPIDHMPWSINSPKQLHRKSSKKKGCNNQAAGAVGFDFSSNGTENFEIPLEKSQFKV